MNEHQHQACIDLDTDPVVATCHGCGETLVHDVGKWARDRGFLVSAATESADIAARSGLIAAAIDKAVNRQPGLVP